MNQYYKIFFLKLIICITSLFGQHHFFVRNIWTDRPLEHVQILVEDDTLISDRNGKFVLVRDNQRVDSLILKLDGFFDQTIFIPELRQPFIYLLPIESTAQISVVRPRSVDSRLMLPSHVTRIDVSQARYSNNYTVDAVLKSQSGILIKSYGGKGQIQSISVRGMSPEQTQVLFDGIPMNSMQLGSVDFGQYPMQNIGSLEIYRGGNSLFGGSGSIGGSIDLHPTKPGSRLGYKFKNTLASFNTQSINVGLDIPVGKFAQSFKITAARGQNDYTTNSGVQKAKLNNRDFIHNNYTYQNSLKINSKIRISSFLNSFKNKSGSPTPFLDPTSEKANQARIQNDNNLAKIKLNYDTQKSGFQLQGYLRNDWMQYQDPTLVINNEPLRSSHFNHESGLQMRFRHLVSNKWLLHTGSEIAWQRIRSTDAGKHERRRLAGYLISDIQVLKDFIMFKSIHLNNTLRIENYSDLGAVFLPGIGFSFQGNYWQIFITGGKNYRAATFNELYWQPGGNPGLSPEKSYNAEVGIEYDYALLDRVRMKFNVYAYQNRISNQIKWLPGGTYWTPQNIVKVISQGMEFESVVSDLDSRQQISFNYKYGIAEKDRAEFAGDATVGNQLPNIPREQWNMNLQTTWLFSQFGFQISGMSFRYNTIQNEPNQILPAHYSATVWGALNYEIYQQQFTISGRVDNLLNKNYEVIRGYPMPPRNYSIALSISY